MTFTKVSDYHMASDPPGYTICRVILEAGVLYELWCGKERVMHEGPVRGNDAEGRAKALKSLEQAAERHAKRTKVAA